MPTRPSPLQTTFLLVKHWCSGLLSTSRGSVDLNEPDLQLLIHHEVEAKELEALVGEMPGADGGLHAHEAASAGRAKEFTEDGGMGDVGR